MARQGQSSWEVIFYETSQGARPAEEWLKEQGPKVGARFGRVFDLLEEYGTNVKGRRYSAACCISPLSGGSSSYFMGT